MTADQFTGKVCSYAKGRPRYAAGLLEHLSKKEALAGKSVADVGSGTGIFSDQLTQIGCTVYAVEPNTEMRLAAERILSANPLFHSVDASAENTSLPDQSVDAVSAAQAFHWFDMTAFQKECRRILRPGGKVFLLWNVESAENNAEYTKEYSLIYEKYCQKYIEKYSFGKSAAQTCAHAPESIQTFFKTYDSFLFENNLSVSKDVFVHHCLSVSCALTPEDAGFDDFVAKLEAFFDKWSVNGRIVSKNNTHLFAGYV